MKHLNKKSSAVLQKLIDCMSDPAYAKTMGSFAKIEKADSCFMPVSIEKLHHIPTFDNHIAVSHTYVENGDLMRDPEMEFVSKDGKFHPISFRQDNMGIHQEVFEYSTVDGRPVKYNPSLLNDLVEFANMWMLNINEQQELGVEV